jgi:hypothetical protein
MTTISSSSSSALQQLEGCMHGVEMFVGNPGPGWGCTCMQM